MKPDPFHLRIVACLGFLGIALGAFGAHGLRETWESTLSAPDAAHRLEVWRTAEFYQLSHAVALLALVLTGASTRYLWTFRCWLAGVAVFSGSLYLFSLTGMKGWGAVTPFGGLMLLAGWLLLALRPRKTEA